MLTPPSPARATYRIPRITHGRAHCQPCYTRSASGSLLAPPARDKLSRYFAQFLASGLGDQRCRFTDALVQGVRPNPVLARTNGPTGRSMWAGCTRVGRRPVEPTVELRENSTANMASSVSTGGKDPTRAPMTAHAAKAAPPANAGGSAGFDPVAAAAAKSTASDLEVFQTVRNGLTKGYSRYLTRLGEKIPGPGTVHPRSLSTCDEFAPWRIDAARVLLAANASCVWFSLLSVLTMDEFDLLYRAVKGKFAENPGQWMAGVDAMQTLVWVNSVLLPDSDRLSVMVATPLGTNILNGALSRRGVLFVWMDDLHHFSPHCLPFNSVCSGQLMWYYPDLESALLHVEEIVGPRGSNDERLQLVSDLKEAATQFIRQHPGKLDCTYTGGRFSAEIPGVWKLRPSVLNAVTELVATRQRWERVQNLFHTYVGGRPERMSFPGFASVHAALVDDIQTREGKSVRFAELREEKSVKWADLVRGQLTLRADAANDLEKDRNARQKDACADGWLEGMLKNLADDAADVTKDIIRRRAILEKEAGAPAWLEGQIRNWVDEEAETERRKAYGRREPPPVDGLIDEAWTAALSAEDTTEYTYADWWQVGRELTAEVEIENAAIFPRRHEREGYGLLLSDEQRAFNEASDANELRVLEQRELEADQLEAAFQEQQEIWFRASIRRGKLRKCALGHVSSKGPFPTPPGDTSGLRVEAPWWKEWTRKACDFWCVGTPPTYRSFTDRLAPFSHRVYTNDPTLVDLGDAIYAGKRPGAFRRAWTGTVCRSGTMVELHPALLLDACPLDSKTLFFVKTSGNPPQDLQPQFLMNGSYNPTCVRQIISGNGSTWGLTDLHSVSCAGERFTVFRVSRIAVSLSGSILRALPTHQEVVRYVTVHVPLDKELAREEVPTLDAWYRVRYQMAAEMCAPEVKAYVNGLKNEEFSLPERSGKDPFDVVQSVLASMPSASARFVPSGARTPAFTFA